MGDKYQCIVSSSCPDIQKARAGERKRILDGIERLKKNLIHKSWKNILPEQEVMSIITNGGRK